MNVRYVVEKRGKLYVCVMEYPERKKGEGVVFYSNSDRRSCVEWTEANNFKADASEVVEED